MIKHFYILILSFNISFASFIDEYTFKIQNGECTELKQLDKDSLKYDLLYRMAYIINPSNANNYLIIMIKASRLEIPYFKDIDSCRKYIKSNLR